jgi:hypothetical protein
VVQKVEREAMIEIDRAQIEQRLKFTRENYRMMRQALLKVVYWTEEDGPPRPLMRDKVEAAKNVVMMDLALLSAEIASGMYKKPLEEMAKAIHYEPVPVEVRAVIIAAWQRGGLLPRAVIEQMIPSSDG